MTQLLQWNVGQGETWNLQLRWKDSAGNLSAAVGIVDRVSNVVVAIGNTTASKALTSASVTNNSAFRVGALANGANQDMEFIAAAVFRKALTPDEIATITNYYTNRGY